MFELKIVDAGLYHWKYTWPTSVWWSRNILFNDGLRMNIKNGLLR